ncbi:hypothetical protein EB001_12380 [bacterium]|nr:hypothetical protein [bacterium]
MTRSKEEALILEIPGGNKTKLTPALAEEFRDLGRRAKKNLVEMALLAQGVSIANKNASGTYNKEFHSWYKTNKMDEVFGTLSNFSKYASAGAAIVRHKDKFGGDLDELPMTITALYVIHDMSDDEFTLAIKDHFIRKDVSVVDPKEYKTKGKKPQPVINPAATAASISAWLKRWRHPPVLKTEVRKLPFLTIKADATVYAYSGDGSFKGHTTVEQLELIEKQITAILAKNSIHVLWESKLDDIKSNVEKKKDAAIRAGAKKKTRGMKVKSSTKKSA